MFHPINIPIIAKIDARRNESQWRAVQPIQFFRSKCEIFTSMGGADRGTAAPQFSFTGARAHASGQLLDVTDDFEFSRIDPGRRNIDVSREHVLQALSWSEVGEL